MKNVTMSMKKKILVIEVDTSQTFGASASGKTITVGTTGGFVASPVEGIKVSLNVNKAKE